MTETDTSLLPDHFVGSTGIIAGEHIYQGRGWLQGGKKAGKMLDCRFGFGKLTGLISFCEVTAPPPEPSAPEVYCPTSGHFLFVNCAKRMSKLDKKSKAEKKRKQ